MLPVVNVYLKGANKLSKSYVPASAICLTTTDELQRKNHYQLGERVRAQRLQGLQSMRTTPPLETNIR